MGYRTHKEGKILRRYETIYITHPELSEEGLSALQEKLNSIMASLKGEMVKLEDWGLKKLGYELGKNTRGHYFLMEYLGAADLVRELERNLRLNDRVLKFQTVRIQKQGSPEAEKGAGLSEKEKKSSEPLPISPEPLRAEAEKEVLVGGEEK
jgi:small subunit ribosomal protein S6